MLEAHRHSYRILPDPADPPPGGAGGGEGPLPPRPWREALHCGAPAFGWRVGAEAVWLGGYRLAHARPGVSYVVPALSPGAEGELCRLLVLLRFFGGGRVRVRSRLNLPAWAGPCRDVEQALGLPVDPWFVLERELHECTSERGAVLVEVTRGEDPRLAARACGLGAAEPTGRVVPRLPQGSVPWRHPHSRAHLLPPPHAPRRPPR